MPSSPRFVERHPRRVLLAAAGAALIATPALHLRAWAQAPSRRLTPAQTEGPFYPVALPADSDADLLANGALRYTRGQAAWVEGTVSDPDGRPLRGAVVEIWQCDEQGRYHHPGDGDRAGCQAQVRGDVRRDLAQQGAGGDRGRQAFGLQTGQA